MTLASLGLYPVISECVPDNQATARDLLKQPYEGNENIALDQFFGSKYLLNMNGEESKNAFLRDLERVGGGKIDIVTPSDYYAEEFKKNWRNYRNYDLNDPVQAKAFDDQRQNEVQSVITLLNLLQGVKKSLIAACQSLQEVLHEQNSEVEKQLKSQVRQFSQVLIFQDDARFGFVDLEQSQAFLNNLRTIFLRAISQLPETWDLFYFEAWAKECPPDANESLNSLRRLGRSLECSAFVVNYKILDALIEQLEKGREPLDNLIGIMNRTHESYASYPSCTYRMDLQTQRLKQSQPIFSPINIQSEAIKIKNKGLDSFKWEQLFGSRISLSLTSSTKENVKALYEIVYKAQIEWIEANIYYRLIQDELFLTKGPDKTAYLDAELQRKKWSSLLIDFESPEKEKNIVSICDTLAKLPKDWRIVYIGKESEVPKVANLPLVIEELTNLRAMAIHYFAYEKLVKALEGGAS